MNEDVVKLRDLAKFIRSKNAGPYRLTFDVVFESDAAFERVRQAGVINTANVAQAFNVPTDRVSSIYEVEMGSAYKITLIRSVPQCSIGETDVYGCQQHVPLMDLRVTG